MTEKKDTGKEKSQLIITPSTDTKDYPIVIPTGTLPSHLERMAQKISSRVIGQERPIRKAIRLLTIYEAGLNDPLRPPGVLLLAGPSGVGKTYFAKELAYAWIGPSKKGKDPWVLIPCGALNERHEKSLLTGSPPGYVGYGQKSVLERIGEYEGGGDPETEINKWMSRKERYIKKKISELPGVSSLETAGEIWIEIFAEIQNIYEDALSGTSPAPRCVVIFDEIEKAHHTVQQTLLNILEEGKLPLHNGRVIDFRGTFILFTTNVGTEKIIREYLQESGIGFALGTDTAKEIKKDDEEECDTPLDKAIFHRVMREIQNPKHFLPEFIGRIGKPGVVVFHVLQYIHYRKILQITFEEQIRTLFHPRTDTDDKNAVLQVAYTEALEDFLIQEGISPIYGARALRSVLERYIKAELAVPILNKDVVAGDIILFDVEFDRPLEGVEKVGNARVVVRRFDRPRDMETHPVHLRKERKVMDIEKILDDMLAAVIKKYSKPPSPHSPKGGIGSGDKSKSNGTRKNPSSGLKKPKK